MSAIFASRRLGVRYDRMGKHAPVAIAVIAGLAAGSANILEKKSRRIELGLYVLSYAIQSAIECWASWGWLHGQGIFASMYHSPFTSQAILSLAFSIIGHAYVRYPKAIRTSYLGAMQSFLDTANKEHPSLLLPLFSNTNAALKHKHTTLKTAVETDHRTPQHISSLVCAQESKEKQQPASSQQNSHPT